MHRIGKHIITSLFLAAIEIYVPVAHSLSSQFIVSDAFPSHSDPPLDGTGRVHVRLLDLVPSSHVLLQSVYELHSDHPPWTTMSKGYEVYQGICFPRLYLLIENK